MFDAIQKDMDLIKLRQKNKVLEKKLLLTESLVFHEVIGHLSEE